MTISGGQSRCSSIRELRAIARPPNFSLTLTDRLYGLGSIYLSLLLARLGATPNGITVTWILIGLAGVLCLLTGGWAVRVTGALLLQLSYILDFVDGEVARLTQRQSLLGPFLDLIGHGLIKVSLPLAVGAAAASMTGVPLYLLAGGLGGVAIGVGDSLRFYAACTSGNLAAGNLVHTESFNRGLSRTGIRNTATKLFWMTFESPGLYGLVLLGTAANHLSAVSMYWAIIGPMWFVMRTIELSRRLHSDRPLVP
jgi:phosphatidylglycerophosphate synthase